MGPPDITLAELVAQPLRYTGMVFIVDDVLIAVAIVLAVVSAVLSYVLQPGPPKPPGASALEDFEAPTVDDGRPIPIVFGTVFVRGPNIVWYGSLSHTSRKKEGVTVGYRYFMGLHMIICQGPVDAVLQFNVGDRQAWSGNVTGNATVTVMSGGLFGGDEGEGGVSGDVEVMFGGPNQAHSPYLYRSDVLDTSVAFRGVLGLVCKGNDGLEGFEPGSGFYFGTSRYIKPWAIKVRREPGRVWDAVDEAWDRWYPAKALIGEQANPAHILYEALTHPEWGMGYPVSIIDDTRFRAAADELYDEGFGLGFVWSKQVQIQEFIQEIINHIGAVLRLDPTTGQFFVKLIRNDYEVGALPVLDENNIIELESFQRVGWGETVNEIVCKYRGVNGRERSITVQNLANIQIQGRIVSQTVDYPGIRSEGLARRVAARDLKAKSIGLAGCRLRVNRTAWALGPGDVFRFSWSELGVADVVMRIAAVSGGTLTDGAITIEAAEDVFGLGAAVVAEVDTEEWEDPSQYGYGYNYGRFYGGVN
jgi:hypothetical protein